MTQKKFLLKTKFGCVILPAVMALFLTFSLSAAAAAPAAGSQTAQSIRQEQDAPATQASGETAALPADLPAYAGTPFTVVNDNVPYFTEEELTAASFESYSELDGLGRCGVAYACIGRELMPTEERGSIGQIKPSGWHTVKYPDLIPDRYLYNRCHLIGYQLTGENSNEKNLITGTRYLNVEGMCPFEDLTADYIKETGNHVLYRVTPVYTGNNLLADGVLMEAESIEDEGNGVLFNVFVYNVQPGILIDYATGDSAPGAAETAAVQSGAEATSVQSGAEAASAPAKPAALTQENPSAQTAKAVPTEASYILNTNTHKFHYPSCASVKQMKEKNKQAFSGDRADVIAMGYDPCKRCNP